MPNVDATATHIIYSYGAAHINTIAFIRIRTYWLARNGIRYA